MKKRLISSVAGLLTLAVTASLGRAADAPVTVAEDKDCYILDNGIVTARVAKVSGDLVSLRYKDLEMLATFVKPDGLPDLEKDPPGENLNGLNKNMTDHQYGFWSHDAMGVRGTAPAIDKITIDPKTNNGERGEVSVKGIADGRKMGTGPGAAKNPDGTSAGDFFADIEIRYTLGRGQSGVYTYCQFEHQASYPQTTITEARCCAKLADFFDWLSIADDPFHNKQYPASLREGDKYIYTTNQNKNRAFGWSSTTKNVGLFFINPSMEYMSGGPTKIEFLGHRDTNQIAAPTVLNYWRSSHYGGAEVSVAAGEHWTKVIGPFMIYVNSGSDSQAIYKDAQAQAVKEEAKWPFAWVDGVDYPSPKDRATVKGHLALTDPIMPGAKMSNVLVGLTAPAYVSPGRGGPPGPGGAGGRMVDWQQDAKHYEFWNNASDDGTFEIPDVRAGTYTMHAFADGVLGEFAKTNVTVEAGKPLDMGSIVWTPVRRPGRCGTSAFPTAAGRNSSRGMFTGRRASERSMRRCSPTTSPIRLARVIFPRTGSFSRSRTRIRTRWLREARPGRACARSSGGDRPCDWSCDRSRSAWPRRIWHACCPGSRHSLHHRLHHAHRPQRQSHAPRRLRRHRRPRHCGCRQ